MEAEMSFWDHLEELRRRLIYCLISIAVLSIFFFSFGIGSNPFWIHPDFSRPLAILVYSKIIADLVPSYVNPVVISPFDAILVNLQLSVLLGIIFSIPVIGYHFFKFVFPGLYPHEKRLLIKILGPFLGLFLGGVAFCYLLILPFVVKFMYQYALGLGAQPLLSIRDFIWLVVVMLLVFGFLFELPLIMGSLTALNIVSYRYWRDNWRYAFLGIFILAGFITPDTSGITMIIVAIPICMLYLAGILLCRYIQTKGILLAIESKL